LGDVGGASGKPFMLDGLKVLDFTQYLAGAGVTRMLAELGADIVKVELPGVGDPGRLLPIQAPEGRGGFFIQHNRGKKSICVDWEQPDGLDLLHQLAATADVVAENFATAEVLDKRGLGYEAVRAVNPKVIYLSVSCFGRTSPWGTKPGFDYIAQAASGLMHMNGYPDGPPLMVSAAVGDGVGAVHGFAALGYALYCRERDGVGQHLDIAMVDSLYHLLEFQLSAPQLSGGAADPIRYGAHSHFAFPAGVFKAPEGWIVVLCLDLQWPAFCRCLGRTDLLDDPRYRTLGDRGARRDELVPIVEAWMAGFATDQDVLDELERHHVPASPVLTIRDTLDHPHFVGREMVRRVPDDRVGDLPIPGFPFKFGAYPDLPDLRADELGEHTDTVLAERLGLSPERIAALHAAGAVHGPDTAHRGQG
jgi:crotonobetainyl-CoA:carnitine CoA-transferase CaiB-like acyl-CoA transferase